MSGPTKGEFQQLSKDVAGLDTLTAVHETQIADLQKQSESIRNQVEILRANFEKLAVDRSEIASEMRLHEKLIERIEKQLDEMDRRRWSFILMFYGSLLAFLANVALLILKLKQ